MSDTATASKAAAQKTMREEQQRTLKLGDFQESEYAYASFSATMPAGVAFEEALKPVFWTNILHLMRNIHQINGPDKTGAVIHLRTEDHAFYAMLYVRATSDRGLIVRCVGPAIEPKTGKACPIDLQTGLPWTGPKAVRSDHFETHWNVGKRGFDIVRKADGTVVADGAAFPTKEVAEEWIAKTTKGS
jgi:hypothetical protein